MPSLGSRTTSYLLKRLVKTPGSKDAGVKSVRLAVNAFTQLTPRQRDVQIVQERWGEWVSPRGLQADGDLIYYIHGGGYFFGSPQTHRPLTTRLAKVSGTTLFALRYRLAPEHLFPAPVQDAVEGYKRLLSQGYRAERIVMAGDSAGGGLVLLLDFLIIQEVISNLMSIWIPAVIPQLKLSQISQLLVTVQII